MIKILIYDDITELCETLELLLGNTDGFEVVGAFDNCETAVTDISMLKPNVVLMNIDMPGCTGIECIKCIRKANQNVKILMQTVFDDNKNIFEAIKAGANGYIVKKRLPPNSLNTLEMPTKVALP